MKSENPFLSVIVPAYNIEKFIGQCIESILQQSYQDFELILVDDGSKDNTGRICDEYTKDDGRIKVIHKDNGGLVSARKTGISSAVGKYVTYVDGDDWLKQDALEIMCRKAIEMQADIVIADFVSIGKEQKNLIQNIDGGFYTKDKLEKVFYPSMLSKGEYFSFGIQPSLCGRMFRRDIILPFQLQVNEKIRLGEDAACCYACFLKAESLYYLKGQSLYCYRMRDTSISHAIIKTYYTDEILLLAEQMKSQFAVYSKIEDALQNQLYFYLVYMIDNMITPNIGLWHLLFSRKCRLEIKKLTNSSIGMQLCDFIKTHHTSSRSKRIIKLIEKDNVSRRMELYLFVRYERIISYFRKKKKIYN